MSAFQPRWYWFAAGCGLTIGLIVGFLMCWSGSGRDAQTAISTARRDALQAVRPCVDHPDFPSTAIIDGQRWVCAFGEWREWK